MVIDKITSRKKIQASIGKPIPKGKQILKGKKIPEGNLNCCKIMKRTKQLMLILLAFLKAIQHPNNVFKGQPPNWKNGFIR